MTSNEADRIRTLQQENRELKRANEILRKASAFFAAELDRPSPLTVEFNGRMVEGSRIPRSYLPTDAGSQYTSIRYMKRLDEIGARPSIGTVADSYDNALAETVNGSYKTQLIRRQGPWRSVDDVELATLSWVHCWNTARLHEALGDIPPAEFEPNHYAALTPA